MGSDSSKLMKPEEIQSQCPVVIYGADRCPYCVKVKKIFDDLKVQIEYRDVDENKIYEQEKQKLMNFLKYETIPLVFIKKQFIGGCAQVKELEAKGELLSKLA